MENGSFKFTIEVDQTQLLQVFQTLKKLPKEVDAEVDKSTKKMGKSMSLLDKEAEGIKNTFGDIKESILSSEQGLRGMISGIRGGGLMGLLGGLAVGGFAFATAITRGTAQTKILADNIKGSSKEIQAMNYALETFGLDGEKASQIITDINNKIASFDLSALAMGGIADMTESADVIFGKLIKNLSEMEEPIRNLTLNRLGWSPTEFSSLLRNASGFQQKLGEGRNLAVSDKMAEEARKGMVEQIRLQKELNTALQKLAIQILPSTIWVISKVSSGLSSLSDFLFDFDSWAARQSGARETAKEDFRETSKRAWAALKSGAEWIGSNIKFNTEGYGNFSNTNSSTTINNNQSTTTNNTNNHYSSGVNSGNRPTQKTFATQGGIR